MEPIKEIKIMKECWKHSAGHDGNSIETLLTCFYFKIQSWNSYVACALHYKNI
jgi:hypothetical protein